MSQASASKHKLKVAVKMGRERSTAKARLSVLLQREEYWPSGRCDGAAMTFLGQREEL